MGRAKNNIKFLESCLGVALRQHPLLILTPPTQPHPTHTPLTSELAAAVQDQARERHVLEALDVACVYMEEQERDVS